MYKQTAVQKLVQVLKRQNYEYKFHNDGSVAVFVEKKNTLDSGIVVFGDSLTALKYFEELERLRMRGTKEKQSER